MKIHNLKNNHTMYFIRHCILPDVVMIINMYNFKIFIISKKQNISGRAYITFFFFCICVKKTKDSR